MNVFDGLQQAGKFQSRTELPYYSWSDWDSVGKVKQALRRLEAGYFDQPSMLVDAMMRDDRIAGVLQTLTDAVPYLPSNFGDGEDDPETDAAREVLPELLPKMIDSAEASQLINWGKTLGIGVGELVWEKDEDTGLLVFRLKTWHPRFLYWNWGSRSFWLQTREGQVELEPGNGQWVLYTPKGYRRAWMHGLVRRLYVPWMLRQWAMRDSGRYSEVYGTPTKKATFPSSASEEEKTRFFDDVAALGNETTIRLPRGADNVPFDLELVEATGTGFEGFERLVQSASVNIAITVLGQNLTTEVKGGSLAASVVHDNVRADVLEGETGAWSQCVNKQMLGPWAQFNFGSKKAAPKYVINAKRPDDKKASADTLKSVGDGISALRGAGIPVSPKMVAERFDLPVDAEDLDDEMLEPREPPEAAPPGEKPLPGKGKPPAKLDNHGADPAIEGQVRIDRLVKDTSARGVLASASQLAKLQSAIEGARDFAELEERIITTFGQLDFDDLAKLLQQAMLLSELEGRFAASKEK